MHDDEIPQRIVSGGQTGVDRAALDVALELGLDSGGWCPRGRLAEDGPIDRRYLLRETSSSDPAERTAWNVRDSDGTLALVEGEPAGGTALAVDTAKQLRRPLLIVDPTRADVAAVHVWIRRNGIEKLNVAGPRESENPGIYAQSRRFLMTLLERSV